MAGRTVSRISDGTGSGTVPRPIPARAFVPARHRPDGRHGQAMVEYALILVLIAIVVVGVLSTLGTRIEGTFQQVVAAL